MYTLIYDLQLNAWISIEASNLLDKPREIKYDSSRKGFYPYSYNFVRRHRGDLAQCSYCGKFLPMKEMTRDHVWPKSLGGEITTTACYTCNTKKRDMLPIQWAIYFSQHMPH